MLVLTAVPDSQVDKLRRAAGARFSTAHVRTWGAVLAPLCHAQVSAS